MRSEQEVILKIRELFDKHNQMSTQISTLLWVINYQEEEKKWVYLQEEFHQAHPGAKETDFRLEYFQKWIGEGKRILDCGVHNGIFTNVYAQNNEVIGIDLQRVIKKYSHSYNFQAYPINAEKGLSIFPDDYFDIIIAGEFIEHLKNVMLFFREASRVLKKDGIIVLSCPYNQDVFDDPFHCNKINEEFIHESSNQYFDIKESIIHELPEKNKVLLACLQNKKVFIESFQHEEEKYRSIIKFLDGRMFDLVIDIGCGDGYFTQKLCCMSNDVIGMDKDINKILEARKKFKYTNLRYKAVDLEVAMITSQKSPDLIILSDIIYYLSPSAQQHLMQNIYDILNNDGILLTCGHLGGGDEELDEYTHLFEKTKTAWIPYENEEHKWKISTWRKK